MDVCVLVHTKSELRPQVEAAVREVNLIQRVFRLRCKPVGWVPHDPTEQKSVRANRVAANVRRRMNGVPTIALTQCGLEPDWFCFEKRGVSVITMADWEDVHAPPPLTTYLMFQFTSALVNFAVNLSDGQISDWPHQPAIGCFFDWYATVRELRRCMVAANLCGDCELKLAGMGLSDAQLAALEQLLAQVRAAAIRRPRTTPSAVFLGHGRSKVWEAVRDYLQQELGLPVEEFNQEATAGISATERIETMLNRSAFGVLVMTAEDRQADKSWHARANVIHEIGLFQGRLGYRRALILMDSEATEFTNIRGMTHVKLPRGPFAHARDAKRDIRRALEREGLLGPAIRNVRA